MIRPSLISTILLLLLMIAFPISSINVFAEAKEAKLCPYNPTKDPIPWLTEYSWHIPWGIVALILMWKEGFIGLKTRPQKIMLVILLICFIFFPAIEAYWHFILPAQYPDLPTYKDTRGIYYVPCP